MFPNQVASCGYVNKLEHSFWENMLNLVEVFIFFIEFF